MSARASGTSGPWRLRSGQCELRWSWVPTPLRARLDEEGGVGGGGEVEERRRAGDLDAVQQVLARDAHHIHGHLAGDELDAELAALVQQLVEGGDVVLGEEAALHHPGDRKSTRLNSSHSQISYAVFCLKKKKKK